MVDYIQYTDEGTDSIWKTFLVYGPNGSGKTTFASTFPYPLFILPSRSENERESLRDKRIPYVTFDSMADLDELLPRLKKDLLRGKIPQVATIVFDNLSSLHLMAEMELREEFAEDKKRQRAWGKFADMNAWLLDTLRSCKRHLVLITHSTVVKWGEDKGNGGYTLKGSAKEFIPDYMDNILYLESMGYQGGQVFYAYLKTSGIWTARVRTSKKQNLALPERITNPSYNKLAKACGWASRKKIMAKIDAKASRKKES